MSANANPIHEPNQDEQAEEFNEKDLDMVRDDWDVWKDVIAKVKIFDHLDDDERSSLVMHFTFVQFNDGDEIILQGDDGNEFFIILDGTAIVYRKAPSNELAVQVSKLSRADYFGAVALSFNRPHAATVKAEGTLKCVKMSQDAFKSDVQPVLNILKRKAAQYNSFVDLSV